VDFLAGVGVVSSDIFCRRRLQALLRLEQRRL